MRKEIIYLALFLALFTSCEEYCKPDLEVVPSTLVVESQLTNNPAKNFVKLSMTQDFYNTTANQDVVGAKVELVQVGGSIQKGIDGGTGYFTFTSSPIPGKKYFLRITNQKDVYQSETVLMPPLPQIDSLYTIHNVEKSYRTDAFGSPQLVETPGRKIYIDAPITSALEYYRFDPRAVLQWVYSPLPHPSCHRHHRGTVGNRYMIAEHLTLRGQKNLAAPTKLPNIQSFHWHTTPSYISTQLPKLEPVGY